MNEIEDLRPESGPSVVSKVAWRSWLLSIPLAFAGALAGAALRQFGGLYAETMGGEGGAVVTAAGLLFAMVILSLCAALVCTLVRPASVAALFIALASGLLLLMWRPAVWSVAGAAVFLLGGLNYLRSVTKGLSERVRFSASWIGSSSSTLLAGFTIAACISLGQGAGVYIEAHGFTFPKEMGPLLGKFSDYYLEAMIPEETQGLVDQTQLQAEFEAQVMQGMTGMLEPYSPYIPLVAAASAYTLLSLAGRLVSLFSALMLAGIFPLLEWLGLFSVHLHRQDVERLVPQ
jgi:hypothetical protein